MASRILIIGASVRAAARSAFRGGHEVSALDLFGDRDLRQIAQVEVCGTAQYPQGLPALAQRLPPAPFCYVGGLENHPRVLSQIQRTRPLYGVKPHALERCRDLFLLPAIAADHGLTAAHVTSDAADVTSDVSGGAADNRWLRKPLASCGGTGIGFATHGRTQTGFFFQQYIRGPVYSGSFLATAAACHLLCVARQFTVRDFGNTTHSDPFAFMAAVGPVALTEKSRDQWTEMGRILADAFELCGLFGIDTIWNRSQRSSPVLLEINPRFTASMELYDLANLPKGPSHAMAMHIATFEGRYIQVLPMGQRLPVFGKAIVYAPVDVWFEGSLLKQLHSELAAGERFVDLPVPPQTIRAGCPVLTVLTQGRCEEVVTARLGVGQQTGLVQRLRDALLRYHTKTDCSP